MQEKFIYDGRFSVTDDGDVYSFFKGARHKMSPAPTCSNGKYRAVCLSINGVQVNRSVHRLVAEAFIPNPSNLPQINHLDGDPSNNAVSNLEWCDGPHNIQHAYDTGLFKQYHCSVCGKDRFCSSGVARSICSVCLRQVEAKEETKQKRIKTGHALMESISWSKSQRAAAFSRLRAQGLTYQEISKIYGCTKQNVQSVIKYNSLHKAESEVCQYENNKNQHSKSDWHIRANT